MKGFKLNSVGDIVIKNNDFDMVTAEELTAQKVRMVLSTNLKDWFIDWEEGINFRNITGKNFDEEVARQEILNGLHQVDDTFQMEHFEISIDKTTRTAHIALRARSGEGQAVEVEKSWA